MVFAKKHRIFEIWCEFMNRYTTCLPRQWHDATFLPNDPMWNPHSVDSDRTEKKIHFRLRIRISWALLLHNLL